jgi:hypothetical protein
MRVLVAVQVVVAVEQSVAQTQAVQPHQDKVVLVVLQLVVQMPMVAVAVVVQEP